MILVTDAGYHGTVAFSANSTLPVSTSISSNASALARAAARLVAAKATIARMKVRNAANGERYKGTIRSLSVWKVAVSQSGQVSYLVERGTKSKRTACSFTL